MWGQLINTSEYSDLKLVKLIVESGKTYFFETLYDRYATFVYNKCFWFVNEEEEAKDLTQDIFIKIYLNLPKFKGASKFSTWVYAITVHTSINYVNQRKNKNKPILLNNDLLQNKFLETSIDTAETTDAELLDINLERLQLLLNILPVSDKMLLLMKYQDNLPISKIAKILGIKNSAVKMRLLRAKKKIVELHANPELILELEKEQ